MDEDKLANAVEDWIADTALKTNGKVFMDDTDVNENAGLTFGDILSLIKIVYDNNPRKQ